MKLTTYFLICLCLLTFSFSQVYAFNRQHYKQMLVTKDCSGCDLRAINLQEAPLLGVNFEGADLRYANFQNAKLGRANFTNAKIRGANFRGANLNKTIWIDGKVCSKFSIGRCVDKR